MIIELGLASEATKGTSIGLVEFSSSTGLPTCPAQTVSQAGRFSCS